MGAMVIGVDPATGEVTLQNKMLHQASRADLEEAVHALVHKVINEERVTPVHPVSKGGLSTKNLMRSAPVVEQMEIMMRSATMTGVSSSLKDEQDGRRWDHSSRRHVRWTELAKWVSWVLALGLGMTWWIS